MVDIGMEYAENTTIPVWVRVFIVLWCKDYEVGVSGVVVKRVLASAKVVSGIINAKDFVSVYDVLLNNDCVAIFDSEIEFVAIIIKSQKPCQKMILQPR
jgi:hypothetical protein